MGRGGFTKRNNPLAAGEKDANAGRAQIWDHEKGAWVLLESLYTPEEIEAAAKQQDELTRAKRAREEAGSR